MTVVRFDTLWENYPEKDPCIDPKTGSPPPGWGNQCAIRLGLALQRSGVSFGSFRGRHCPVSTNKALAASAQQLANWLKTRPFTGCPRVESFTGSSVFQSISGRTGIIFLANYWQRESDGVGARSGDHIDLWNGSRMFNWFSWVRVQLNFSIDGIWSDYRLASTAMFWHLP